MSLPWAAIPLAIAAIACSRTPKCRLDPLRSSFEKSPLSFMTDLFEGARSADPPMRLGILAASLFSTSPEEFLVALALLS